MSFSTISKSASLLTQKTNMNGSKCSNTFIILNTLSESISLPASVSLRDSFNLLKICFIRSERNRPKNIQINRYSKAITNNIC